MSSKAPKAHRVSYSGLCIRSMGRGPRSYLTMPPQRRGQEKQPYFSISCLHTASAPIFWERASGKSSREPDQFLMGESPLSADMAVSAGVPKRASNRRQRSEGWRVMAGRMRVSLPVAPRSRSPSSLFMGLSKEMAALKSLVICLTRGLSATPTRARPVATTALSPLAPITPPSPPRAAMRPSSLQMPAMKLLFSPAGPMQATWQRGPWSSLSRASVAAVSSPHSSPASSSSTPSALRRR